MRIIIVIYFFVGFFTVFLDQFSRSESSPNAHICSNTLLHISQGYLRPGRLVLSCVSHIVPQFFHDFHISFLPLSALGGSSDERSVIAFLLHTNKSLFICSDYFIFLVLLIVVACESSTAKVSLVTMFKSNKLKLNRLTYTYLAKSHLLMFNKTQGIYKYFLDSLWRSKLGWLS